MRPVPQGGDRTAKAKEWSYKQAQPLFQAKAEGLAKAGCDLIIMEMMRDVDYSLWATEAAVATGLPVWVGISVERRPEAARDMAVVKPLQELAWQRTQALIDRVRGEA